MPSSRASEFLENLRASRLLDEERLQEVATWRSAVAGDDRRLAKELVASGLLTGFQAEQILHGYTQFFYGPYKVVDRIGAGGMAEIFKAVHPQARRTVAIKVIRESWRAHPEVHARFMREVRAITKLSHPNVVAAYDVGQQADMTYLVLEYVDGRDLGRIVREHGRLDPALAADIAYQTALALQHADERGIVHRDIKPGNILIDSHGTVKVLDMGLARIRRAATDPDKSQTLTRTGQAVGTVDYLSPEQAKDSHSADIRADIYSLGCTLYLTLAGQAPFPGHSVIEKLMKHRDEEAVPVAELAPDVPPGLAKVVRRMMAKRVEDRFQTPAAVAEALKPFRLC